MQRSRMIGGLMTSVALTAILLIVGDAEPLRALNCCQTCESIDATCWVACDDACDGDPNCLANCEGQCEGRSAACWGIQGQGPYCIYCSYGCTYVWWEVDPYGYILDSWCI
jgi:hypothetical protein